MATRRSPAGAVPSQRIPPQGATLVASRSPGSATSTTAAATTQEQRVHNVVLTRFAVFLLATSVLGTIYSLRTQTAAHTAFRSRLPASALKGALASASSASSSSLFPSTLPYFADKRNFFNQYFVKLGWFWTVFAYLAHAFTLALSPPPTHRDGIVVSSPSRVPSLLRQLRSLALSTLYWYALTQGTWFLTPGSSISRRILIYSGAECVPSALSSGGVTQTTEDVLLHGPKCTDSGRGEYYRGGHDVSGHTFLLVLSSLLLVDLVGPAFLARHRVSPAVRATTLAALTLVGLWWWMLVATSVYFHTPAEKATGFIFALGGWLVSRL